MYCKRCESGNEYMYEKDGKTVCRFCEEYHPTEDPSSEIMVYDLIEDEIKKKYNTPVDYIEYLKPIIDDVKDGKEKLDQSDVDFIIKVCKAKIEYSEGLITKEIYEQILFE